MLDVGVGLPTTVGERIRELRRDRGLSQVELAEAVGVTPSYISVVESGRRVPRRNLMEALAQEFKVPAAYLATGANEYEKYQVELDFGELLLRNKDAEQAKTTFEAVAAKALGPLGAPLRRQAEWGLARAFEHLGKLSDSRRVLEGLLERPNLPPDVNRAEVVTEFCYVLAHQGDVATALDRGLKELASLRAELDRLEQQARADRSAAPESVSRRHRPEEVLAARRFAELAATLVECYREMGDLGSAEELNREAIQVAERRGSLRARGVAYWVAAEVANDRGNVREARRLNERALAIFGEADSDTAVAALKVNAVIFALAEGSIDGASGAVLLADLQAAIDCFEEQGSRVEVAEARRLMAQVYLELGDVTSARDAVDQAVVPPKEAPLEAASIAKVRADVLRRERGGAPREVIAAYREAIDALGRVEHVDRATRHNWATLAEWLRDVKAHDEEVTLLRHLVRLSRGGS